MPRTNFSKIDALPEQDKLKIESFAKSGYSFKYIHEYLETRGFKIHLKTVQNWHKKFLESIAPDDEKAEKALKAVEKLERDTTPNPVIDNEQELEKIRDAWGLPDIETQDKDPEACIGASQRLSYDLFVDAALITKNRLNLYKKGEAKYPLEQIRGLKILYEMFAPLQGIEELISLESAMRTFNRGRKEYEQYKKEILGIDEEDEQE